MVTLFISFKLSEGPITEKMIRETIILNFILVKPIKGPIRKRRISSQSNPLKAQSDREDDMGNNGDKKAHQFGTNHFHIY
jgi:hypothetical protein